jgi:hypothetical protein
MGWIVLAPGTLKRITDEQFAEYVKSDMVWPKVIITGDGHRTPAFTWTESCRSVRDFFVSVLANAKLYAYAEVRPQNVEVSLVPAFLAAL